LSHYLGVLTPQRNRFGGTPHETLPYQVKLLFEHQALCNHQFLFDNRNYDLAFLLAYRRDSIDLPIDDNATDIDLLLEQRHVHGLGTFLQVLSDLYGSGRNLPLFNDEVFLNYWNHDLVARIPRSAASAFG
jgi:hypothetical protein